MITLKSGVKIGDSSPTFIIAEVGSNWSSLADCLTSIGIAKACGADAVKFQLFDPDALYGTCVKDLPPETTPILDLTGVSPYLNPSWLPLLKEQADMVGIEFMCSAFSPELVEAVDPYVNIHKVASAEMNHVRILEKLRSIGKPVILSTGASTEPDIGHAVDLLGGTEKVLMYCEGAYPARNTLLAKMNLLKEKFNTLVGLSDHSLDVYMIPMQAVIAGACVIEKHVNFVDSKGPDAPHSLNQEEFTRMVKAVRGELPPAFLGPSPDEQDMVTTHKRRLIAIKDINPGDVLVEGQNFGIYRSLKKDCHGFSPYLVDKVNGSVALRSVKAGDGIGPGDI